MVKPRGLLGIAWGNKIITYPTSKSILKRVSSISLNTTFRVVLLEMSTAPSLAIYFPLILKEVFSRRSPSRLFEQLYLQISTSALNKSFLLISGELSSIEVCSLLSISKIFYLQVSTFKQLCFGSVCLKVRPARATLLYLKWRAVSFTLSQCLCPSEMQPERIPLPWLSPLSTDATSIKSL